MHATPAWRSSRKFAAVCVAGLAVLLSACGSPAPEPAATADSSAQVPSGPGAAVAASQGTGAERPAVYSQCAACHAVEPGKNGVGPSLAGVVGRKAGAVAGFSYSAAMTGSGLTWDAATLDQFLAAPMKTVPGTKMSYAGMPDAVKRKEVIEYLATLK